MHCHAHPGNKTKHQKTRKQKPHKKHQTQKEHKHTKQKTNNQKQPTPQSSDVTGSIKARGDSLVSSRCMHNDILCAMMTQALNRNKNQETPQKHQGPIQRVWEATQLNAGEGKPGGINRKQPSHQGTKTTTTPKTPNSSNERGGSATPRKENHTRSAKAKINQNMDIQGRQVHSREVRTQTPPKTQCTKELEGMSIPAQSADRHTQHSKPKLEAEVVKVRAKLKTLVWQRVKTNLGG